MVGSELVHEEDIPQARLFNMLITDMETTDRVHREWNMCFNDLEVVALIYNEPNS